MAGKTVVMCLF